MEKDLAIILVESDITHTSLFIRNLKQAGVDNEILQFRNGHESLDFLFQRGDGLHRIKNTPYVLVLDIPETDGVEVLRQIKQDERLRIIPTIIIMNTDDPSKAERCYKLGCSIYITKPVDYERFIETINRLGLILTIIEVPKVNHET